MSNKAKNKARKGTRLNKSLANKSDNRENFENTVDSNIENSDSRTEKRKTGDLGENIAETFLVKQGYEIIERNYLKKFGELDIIAKKDAIYHFVEVKTVSCETLPDVNHETDGYKPEDNVHPWKLKRLSKTIQAYILEKKIFDYEWQFDVALVYLNTKTRLARVKLLEDIIL